MSWVGRYDRGIPENVVLLHGFAGTARTFDRVVAALPPERYTPLALDLPGHGAARSLRPITFERCVEHVLEQSPERFLLCGYSMGGRIALNLALAASERVSAMVIVSANPGIEDERARKERRLSDEVIARELESRPLEHFIERWRGQPLFADQPDAVRKLAVEDHRRNDPVALAAAMRGLGTGTMQPLWGRLRELRMPVVVLAGERDRKYVQLGRRMASLLPRGELRTLPGGHSLALESPDAVAAAIQECDPAGDSAR